MPAPVVAPAPSAPLSMGAPCNTPSLEPGEVWARVLQGADGRESLLSKLQKLKLVSLTPQRAVIGHAPRDRFTAEMAIEQLKALLAEALGTTVSVQLMPLKDEAPVAPAPVPIEGAATAPKPAAPPAPGAPALDERAAREHPLVKRAEELLSGRVVRVGPRPKV